MFLWCHQNSAGNANPWCKNPPKDPLPEEASTTLTCGSSIAGTWGTSRVSNPGQQAEKFRAKDLARAGPCTKLKVSNSGLGASLCTQGASYYNAPDKGFKFWDALSGLATPGLGILKPPAKT